MNAVRATQLAIVAAAVAVLEALCRSHVIDPLTLIPPSRMLLALITIIPYQDWFWPDVLYSLRNLAAAIALSIVLGFAIGLAVHAWPRLRRILDPLFSSYYAVPTFVLYPLLIVMFGIGPASLIVMGALFGIVAMIVATLNALDRVAPVIHKVARVMRLGPLRRTVLVQLPAAAPHLFTGLRLAVAYSVIGIVAGEFILATAGIGRRLSLAYNDFDNQTMYAILLMILGFAAGLNALLNCWERALHARWYRGS
jgi:NitT/TauT family transport system permease protein